jgi:hypothetical protein
MEDSQCNRLRPRNTLKLWLFGDMPNSGTDGCAGRRQQRFLVHCYGRKARRFSAKARVSSPKSDAATAAFERSVQLRPDYAPAWKALRKTLAPWDASERTRQRGRISAAAAIA